METEELHLVKNRVDALEATVWSWSDGSQEGEVSEAFHVEWCDHRDRYYGSITWQHRADVTLESVLTYINVVSAARLNNAPLRIYAGVPGDDPDPIKKMLKVELPLTIPRLGMQLPLKEIAWFRIELRPYAIYFSTKGQEIGMIAANLKPLAKKEVVSWVTATSVYNLPMKWVAAQLAGIIQGGI